MNLPTVEDIQSIQHVASSISAGNDDIIGSLIADALAKLAEGVISLEEGKGIITELEITEGMKLERFISPYFITNTDKMEVS
jgi:chaperonin GroEL